MELTATAIPQPVNLSMPHPGPQSWTMHLQFAAVCVETWERWRAPFGSLQANVRACGCSSGRYRRRTVGCGILAGSSAVGALSWRTFQEAQARELSMYGALQRRGEQWVWALVLSVWYDAAGVAILTSNVGAGSSCAMLGE